MARIHTTISGQEIRYHDPDAKLERFLKRVFALAEDEDATDDDLVVLIYGRENPILDHTLFPERGAVTREVLDNPVYGVLTDLLARKTLARTKTTPERLAARYTVTVAEAAEQKGVSEDAIRKAIRERRLSAWKKDGVYYLEPKSLEAVSLGGRGPAPKVQLQGRAQGRSATSGSLSIRAGHEGDVSFKVKAPGASESKPPARLDKWSRVGVLTGGHGKLRFFELEPGGEPNELEFHGFHARGPFRVVRKVNNAKAAREAWEAFEPS